MVRVFTFPDSLSVPLQMYVTIKIQGNSLEIQWLGLFHYAMIEGTLIAGAQVQSLVGELRLHNMCDVAKYIYLNGNLVKAMVFPVVMYGYETWTIKKAEC